jgi:nucleoside-diphosphate-sugar epimerase
MRKIAVFGGTGYLASLIKNQNNIQTNKYFFFSRKKGANHYINFSLFKKNLKFLKNFDFIVHLVGPNQNQLLKNKNLIKKKNKITSDICDLCLIHNIKLIYISSAQVYKNYGKNNLSINSKINLKNYYSKSHYDSEKIIKKKFLNRENMFIILRIGNVFGFSKYENLREINNNLIHSLCISALKNKKIIIKNGSIQRMFVPSQIFVQVLNSIIIRNFFKNSVINIFYKNSSLIDIARIIQKRSKFMFNLTVDIIIKKFTCKKKIEIYDIPFIKFKNINKKFHFEIDRILKNFKKF